MVKVKICGITNEHDALKAAEFGADYIGFLAEIGFSEDSVTKEKAGDIIKKLPLELKPVMVTYLDRADKIVKLAEAISPEIIQLHNPSIGLNEIGEIRKALPKMKLTKTIHVEDESAVKLAKKFERYVDFMLLDTMTNSKPGGTGKVHNWDISRKIVKSVNCRVFLAGGLSPDNVEEAIKRVRPFAVDTNSGVKCKPGMKDMLKMKRFIQRAKERIRCQKS